MPSSSSRPSRAQRLLPLLALALLAPLLAPSCASGGSGRADARASEADAVPMRITLRDYLGGTEFELVNPAHTDPVEYYSRTRQSASRKIVTTEIVAALLEYLEDNGFEEYAALGSLPAGVRKGTRGFEVEGPGGIAHWLVRTTSDADERVAMNECTQTFLQTYNVVMAYQTVENETGGRYFKSAEGGAR